MFVPGWQVTWQVTLQVTLQVTWRASGTALGVIETGRMADRDFDLND